MDIGKLGESHFNLDKDNSEWLKFCKFTYKINLEQSDTEADEPLLTNLERHMSNWTPQGSDKVPQSEKHSRGQLTTSVVTCLT